MSQQLLKHSRLVVNIFGAVGYSLVLIVYVISTGVLLMWLVGGGHLTSFGMPPEHVETVDEPGGTGSASPIMITVSYVVAAFMAITSLFVLVSLPYWLGKLGSRLLKRAIRLCHIPVTAVSLILAKFIACGLALVPISAFLISDNDLIPLAVGAFIIITSAAIVFVLQHSLAKMSRFDAKDIW